MRLRLDPIESMPLRRGCCDWCGREVPVGRIYCGKECRERYNALVTRQGKALVQLLKQWRLHRGRKGTPGAGKISAVAARVDMLLVEDRERWRSCARSEREEGA